MQNSALGAIGLLVFVGLSMLQNTSAITNEEKDTILKGIDAGKSFTGVLEQSNFGDVLKELTGTIGPWIEGIGMFGSLIGMFLPEENEMLEEMKKGFKEVNKRLDAIKDEITEVKEAIDWAVVKVKFVEIETNIRLLDEKLKEVHLAPNPDDGKDEYIRVYEDHYDEAGLKLFDAIVHNDQIFSENILKAGMEYTDYVRVLNQDYMRGLIALMMKSSNIEVSYEKFKEQDRGMELIWKLRLEECQEAMENADKVLENAWSDLMADEINELAKACDGCSHIDFRDITYKFLSEKYYWRYWFVLSYDDVGGWKNHAISRYTDLGHHMFRYYGRNFVVATSDSSRVFDENTAKSYVVNRNCQSDFSKCVDDAALELINAAPFYGVMQAAISERAGWAVVSIGSRSTWGTVYLIKDWWSAKFTLFYFG